MNESVSSSGTMTLTGETWSTRRKIIYSLVGRLMNVYEVVVEWNWQGKTEVLGEKNYTDWLVDEWMDMELYYNDT